MTEPAPFLDPAADQIAAAQRARVAELAQGRSSKRRRHPAQGARIAAAGLGASTMLGLVGAMAYAQPPAPIAAAAPAATAADVQPQVVVVVHRTGVPDTVAATVGDQTGTRAATPLTVRPTVRPASPEARAPAASTNGSH